MTAGETLLYQHRPQRPTGRGDGLKSHPRVRRLPRQEAASGSTCTVCTGETSWTAFGSLRSSRKLRPAEWAEPSEFGEVLPTKLRAHPSQRATKDATTLSLVIIAIALLLRLFLFLLFIFIMIFLVIFLLGAPNLTQLLHHICFRHFLF